VFQGPFAIIDDSNDPLVSKLVNMVIANCANAILIVKTNDIPIQHWQPLASWSFNGI
jgi:hypothetical protein